MFHLKVQSARFVRLILRMIGYTINMAESELKQWSVTDQREEVNM